MEIHEISITRLKEYENNPRTNDLAVEKVKYSIERFGFLFPVVIDINYVIVCGHTRVRACRELGVKNIPCIIADDLSEEQINLFRLVDNKTSEYSDWDFEKLQKELSLIDISIEKNQLLLERFELTPEVFDIEPEQAEIAVQSLNFIQHDNIQSTPSDDSLKTPDSEESGLNYEENLEVENDSTPEENLGNEENFASEIKIEKKKSNPLLPLHQFRFGDVAFFISKVELDKLYSKYEEYMDSDNNNKGSFIEYLLRGVGTFD